MLRPGVRLCFLLLPLFVFLGLEARFPLRSRTQGRLKRLLTNLAIGATGAGALRFTLAPLVFAASSWVVERRLGILPAFEELSGFSLPGFLRLALGLAFLDYTLYFWHALNHKISWLWRFHNVHHVDLDLDTTTALRFHFGELLISAFFRIGQIALFGIDPWTLAAFEVAVTASAQFHHSNLRLPLWFEDRLSWVLVTPRMHGIHHSDVRAETDSNFSTILSVWDRLHGSFRRGIPQERIRIGVPAYRDPRELTVLGSLLLPFGRQRDWPAE